MNPPQNGGKTVLFGPKATLGTAGCDGHRSLWSPRRFWGQKGGKRCILSKVPKTTRLGFKLTIKTPVLGVWCVRRTTQSDGSAPRPPLPVLGRKRRFLGQREVSIGGGGGAPFLVFFWGVLRVFWDLFVVPVNKLCVLCAAGAKGSETCPMRRSFWVKKWQKRGQSAKITTKPKRGLKM